MMTRFRFFYRFNFLALLVVLSGCALFNSNKDNAPSPMSIPEFEAKNNIDVIWQERIGSGTNKEALMFYLQTGVIDGEPAFFVNDHQNRVFARRLDDGRSLWQVKLNKKLNAGVGIDERHVYVVSNDGTVYALDINNGQIIWEQPLIAEVLAPPVIGEGRVIIHTSDSRVLALSPETGEEIWEFLTLAPPLTLRGSSTPKIIDDVVVTGLSNGHLVAIEIGEGRLLFDYPIATPRGRTEIERLVDINGQIGFDNGVIYVVTYQGKMLAFDVRTGQTLWSRDMSSYRGLSVDSKAVYVTDTDSVIWALDKKTGYTLWQQDELQYRQLTVPVSYKNSILVGDFEGNAITLDSQTGVLQNVTQIDDSGINSPMVTSSKGVLVYGVSGRTGLIELN